MLTTEQQNQINAELSALTCPICNRKPDAFDFIQDKQSNKINFFLKCHSDFKDLLFSKAKQLYMNFGASPNSLR